MTAVTPGDDRSRREQRNGRRALLDDLSAQIAVVLLVSAAYFFLFAFRSADDNALTSWRWIFPAGDVPRGLLLVNASLALALALARLRWPARLGGAFLFAASFACAAAFWREPEVIVDAARYFTQAKHLELHGAGYFLREWGKGIFAWTDLPLVPFLYGATFRIFGEARLYSQIFVTTLFAGTVLLTYRIGKRFWGEEAGFSAGALLLATPYLWTQVPLMLVDVPTMFFHALAVFTFLRALEEGGLWAALLAPAAVLLAVFSKYSTWPLLSVLVVTLLAYALAGPGPRAARTCLARGAAVGLIALAVAGAAVALKWDVFQAQIELLRTYQLAGLRRWTESLTSTFLFQVSPVVTAAALASLPVAWRRRDWRCGMVLWPVLVLLLLGAERARYTIPVLPFLALLAACGLQGVRNPGLRRLAVLSAVLPSLAIALFAYLPFLAGTSAANLQRAGAYLNAARVRQVAVFTPPAREPFLNPAVAVPLLDLYTRGRLAYFPGELPGPPAEELARSSLRFTWEMASPDYYAGDTARSEAVAVISDTPRPSYPLPGPLAHRLRGDVPAAVFATAGDPFRYKTIVTLFLLEGTGGVQPLGF